MKRNNIEILEKLDPEIAALLDQNIEDTLGYDLRLIMPDLNLREKTLYVKKIENSLSYQVISSRKGIVRGEITQDEMGGHILNPEEDLDTFKLLLPRILKITAERGHTESVKEALQEISADVVSRIFEPGIEYAVLSDGHGYSLAYYRHLRSRNGVNAEVLSLDPEDNRAVLAIQDSVRAEIHQLLASDTPTPLSRYIGALLCPLTGKLMNEPMIFEDGRSYNRSALEKFADAQNLPELSLAVRSMPSNDWLRRFTNELILHYPVLEALRFNPNAPNLKAMPEINPYYTLFPRLPGLKEKLKKMYQSIITKISNPLQKHSAMIAFAGFFGLNLAIAWLENRVYRVIYQHAWDAKWQAHFYFGQAHPQSPLSHESLSLTDCNSFLSAMRSVNNLNKTAQHETGNLTCKGVATICFIAVALRREDEIPTLKKFYQAICFMGTLLLFDENLALFPMSPKDKDMSIRCGQFAAHAPNAINIESKKMVIFNPGVDYIALSLAFMIGTVLLEHGFFKNAGLLLKFIHPFLEPNAGALFKKNAPLLLNEQAYKQSSKLQRIAEQPTFFAQANHRGRHEQDHRPPPPRRGHSRQAGR